MPIPGARRPPRRPRGHLRPALDRHPGQRLDGGRLRQFAERPGPHPLGAAQLRPRAGPPRWSTSSTAAAAAPARRSADRGLSLGAGQLPGGLGGTVLVGPFGAGQFRVAPFATSASAVTISW